MDTIGFGGTYYTLWYVATEVVHIEAGASYENVIYSYIKNLSKSRDEAIDKAGTNNIDESLRGKKRSFSVKKGIILAPERITEIDRLFRILFRNDSENLVEGVRKSALDQAIKLRYVTKLTGEFSNTNYSTGVKAKSKTAYKWNSEMLRNQSDCWVSDCDGDKLFFIGII